MSVTPPITVGLPVYNGSNTIRQVLNSLLSQSFTDFILVISDNASTDDTGTICQEYASIDSRVRYIRQSQNIGAEANFRFVFQAALSEYFMWAAA
ncbi:MAG: glycosyltransferase family 2 protein, partial [Saprospiraceae bacterium]|nr:glycosyltransferase family 2 protein [Saprospiraceae bacterium]